MRKTLFILSLCYISLSPAQAQKQFWGSSSFGGLYGNGFLFKTDSIGDNLEIVHDFQSSVDGENISAILLASNNKLYGLASAGGQGGSGVFATGTFFEYDLATDRFRVLEHFGASNTHLPGITTPRAEGVPSLTEVSPGVIFGLMYQGRYVFSYNVATGVFTKPFTVPTYKGGPSNSTLQNQFCQAFYKAADNFLYAATPTNSSCPIGNPNMGSIVRVNPANNTLAIRHLAVCLVDYGYSYNGFFAEANGNLYGTTNYGGANNQGVIFAYNTAANTYTKVHDFANSVYSYEPTSLVRAKNGKLYGTAHGGGTPEPNLNLNAGGGVLFEFDLTTNTFTKKHDFTLTGQSIYDMGIFPSGLISSTNGKLYGATQYGVFEYNPVSDEIRVAGRFNGQGFAPSFVQVCRKPAYQSPTATTYTICHGAAFSLDLASVNATTVTWKHNNVVDASQTTTTLNFTAFSAADAGTWICTMTNECGTTVAPSITLVFGQPAQPTITAGSALTFCAGGSVTLSAPEGFDSYNWSTGETSRQILVSESGSYTVRVSNGCESPVSAPAVITVNALPEAVTIATNGPVDFCAGATVKLSAPEGFDGYTWSNGATLREIEVSQSGNYSVKVNDGCESPASDAVTVTVHSLPVATISASGPLVFCADETVTLSAPAGFSGYAWSTGATTQAIDVNESGHYTVKVNDGCESPPSNATVVTANALPPRPELVALPSGTELVASGSSGTYDWTWNNEPLNEHGSQLNATETGTYAVYSVSAEGCRSTDFASVSLVINGTESAADDAVFVYPNPSQGTVNLKSNNALRGQADISLFNSTGGVAFAGSVDFGEESSTIHLGNLPAGLYDLRIRKGDQVVHRKVVVQ
ncbi:Por secretion system C-terminal sorting domain-containing protein [Chryseolinea serpens]|uniref:Por secretion system C-terminal sorting domain-containing protein n=1 Tax=Chryseolinea serpens TaxID=947013 RepID=A0A1M5MA59_9BACT|nr:choice-of-anchor tandem repeat GloVer-containing protein [Chryseolinea serpens]SHG74172.1 Por secretion system C-terminal sorting domain-containing protein [Chryseolinea serpens]